MTKPLPQNRSSLARGGKTVYGAAVGILMLETRFPRIPGDIGNSLTWPFPVHYRVVPGSTPDQAVRQGAKGLLKPFIEAGEALVAMGADGITTTCGFLSLFQAEMAAALEVPVATSSLMQAPLIQRLLPPNKQVGIITISKESLTAEHLTAVGVDPDIVVVGTEGGRNFSHAILDDQPTLDVEASRLDLLDAAAELLERQPSTGAILLECTNMTPYAADIRMKFGLPVYSIYTFVQWFQAGLLPRAFTGPLADPRP